MRSWPPSFPMAPRATMGEVTSSTTADPVWPSPARREPSAGGWPRSSPPPTCPSGCWPAPPSGCPQLDGAVPVAFGGYGDRASAWPRRCAGSRRCSWSRRPRSPPTGSTSTARSSTRRPRPACGTSSTPRSTARRPTASFTLGRDHFATEEHIRASGVAFTFLRDNFYLDFLPDDRRRGRRHPRAGRRRDGSPRSPATTSPPAPRAVLADPAPHVGCDVRPHRPGGAHVRATSPRRSRAHRGREVTFHDETVEEAYESRRQWAAPDWQYDAWVSTYTAIAAGECAGLSDDVRRLTGAAAADLAELLAARRADRQAPQSHLRRGRAVAVGGLQERRGDDAVAQRDRAGVATLGSVAADRLAVVDRDRGEHGDRGGRAVLLPPVTWGSESW